MTTVYEPDDAATVLADFGVPVVVRDGPSTSGLLDTRVIVAQHFGVELRAGESVLSVVPGSLGAIATDQALTVQGVAYRYRGLFEGPQDLFERHVVAREVTPP